MNTAATTPFSLFLPCARGCEAWLLEEARALLSTGSGKGSVRVHAARGGVRVERAAWDDVIRLNLASRLAQRVLIEVAHGRCADARALYALAASVPWERWFEVRCTFRVDITAHAASGWRSLNYAALCVKDAVADRFRARSGGVRPSVDTHAPDVRIAVHLEGEAATLSIDTSGEPLFKRGWRQGKGDAPLKETLAAAMLAACGWWLPGEQRVLDVPLYDPCCGSGTIVIEAAQMLLGLPAGWQRRFGFERLRCHDAARWRALRQQAAAPRAAAGAPRIFGSDVSHRMVDFAARNAQRAGVAEAVQFRGGDALARLPPAPPPGVLLLNPPYGQRIAAAGAAGVSARQWQQGQGREGDVDEFFTLLAAHWKSHYGGWTAWLLTPDAGLPARLRLKATRRVPLYNGPIECRLMRFELQGRQAPRETQNQ